MTYIMTEQHKQKIREASLRNGSKPPVRDSSRAYPHSEETKRKISIARTGQKLPKASETKRGKPIYKNRGENHYNWRGGISPERAILGMSIEYREWRTSVFKRDDYTCQECWTRGGELNADHIEPYCLNKELALDIDNGRTLCVECHRKTDTYGWKMVHKKRKLETV